MICLQENGVTIYHPFLPYDDDANVWCRRALQDAAGRAREYQPVDEIREAIKVARAEDIAFKDGCHRRGKEAISSNMPRAHGKKVHSSCREEPYHLDPEINHGIDKMITFF